VTARDVDVLVIGSGAAGLCAALAAHEAGATVLVAESEAVVGGSSRLSGGVVMGSGSSVQRAAGIADSPELMYREYMALNQWQVMPGPVRTLAFECGATIDWLIDHGVHFEDRLIYGGDESQPRSHVVTGRGDGLIDPLHARCREADIDIALGLRVDRLLVDNGRVVGAAVGDDELRAGAVVLATGGFGANPARLQQLFPSAWHEGWTWYIGADGSRGDAIDLTEPLGAMVVNHDRGLRTLEPHFIQRNEAILPGWLVIVDQAGQRFMDESAPYGIADAMMRRVGDVAYVIFDDAAIHPPADRVEFYKSRYKQAWPGMPPFQPRNWIADVIDPMVAEGRVSCHATVEAVAVDLGIDSAALAGTIERYNEFAATGHDGDYAKNGTFLAPLSTPPFYGVVVRPTVVNLTATGLRIDADTRVVGRHGRAIEGLFAAGECTGGVIGAVYMGSGNSLGNSTTMGRVAGRAAALHTTERPPIDPSRRDLTPNFDGYAAET
jgi:flavocytochrome c